MKYLVKFNENHSDDLESYLDYLFLPIKDLTKVEYSLEKNLIFTDAPKGENNLKEITIFLKDENIDDIEKLIKNKEININILNEIEPIIDRIENEYPHLKIEYSLIGKGSLGITLPVKNRVIIKILEKN